MYGINYTTTITSSSSSAASFLSDGSTLVRLMVTTALDLSLEIHTLDNSTGTFGVATTIINPTASGSKTVIDIAL